MVLTRQKQRDGSTEQAALVDEAATPPAEQAFGVGLIVGALAVAAVAVFVVQNRDSVEMRWLAFEWEMPLWIALGGAILVGVVSHPIGLAAIRRVRARRERRTRAAERLRRRDSSR